MMPSSKIVKILRNCQGQVKWSEHGRGFAKWITPKDEATSGKWIAGVQTQREVMKRTDRSLRGNYPLVTSSYRSLSTAVTKLQKGNNAPCVIKKVKPKCEFPKHKEWTGCTKVCMPCCKPKKEPCEAPEPRERTCQGPVYRIPSATECQQKHKIRPSTMTWCTRIKCTKPGVGSEITKPFITVQERVDAVLGRKSPAQKCHNKPYSTHCGPQITPLLNSSAETTQFRQVSTSTSYGKEEECKVQGKLPCVKSTELPGGKKAPSSSNKACEKVCAPCCPPARDPPECFYPYKKPPCTKHKPPRPSYSECRKSPVKMKPCECQVEMPPPCKK